MPYAETWRDLEIIILIEVSQTGKDKYHMISLICGILKMIQMNLFTRQKQTHRHRKQNYGYQRERVGGWERINKEFGINRYTLLYIK